jgi:hypothetical protein
MVGSGIRGGWLKSISFQLVHFFVSFSSSHRVCISLLSIHLPVYSYHACVILLVLPSENFLHVYRNTRRGLHESGYNWETLWACKLKRTVGEEVGAHW